MRWGALFFGINILFGIIALSPVQAQKITTILLFGDSLTTGYHITTEQSLPARLQTFFDKIDITTKIIDGGIVGDTTGKGKKRLKHILKLHNPDIVVLALGSNDVLRGIPPNIVRKNLDAMLVELKKSGALIILSSVQTENLGYIANQDFNNIYPELAKKHHVDLYPFFLDGLYGDAGLMLHDGIHPNAAGVNVIARKLGLYLLKKINNE